MNIAQQIWADLEPLGFSGSVQSLPELYSWLRRVALTYTVPSVKLSSNGFSYKGVKFSDLTSAMNGKFGICYLAYREGPAAEDASYCFVKTTPNFPQVLLMEAILQQISHSTLKQYGFPDAVPKVLDIVKHPTFGVTMAVDRIPGAKLFADYLKGGLKWGAPTESNDRLVLSVLAQVATYLAILELSAGINHRDLKGTNVLMIDPVKSIHQTVQIGVYTWTIQTNQQVILIDFGFSCIGRPNGQTVVSAGDFLLETDFCPKEGRDLFLFFASLWNVEAFRDSLTPRLQGLFRKWLHDKTDVSWADWLVTTAQESLTSMYLLTNAGHFRSATSAPLQVLQDIAELYPEIVSMNVTGRPPTPIPQ